MTDDRTGSDRRDATLDVRLLRRTPIPIVTAISALVHSNVFISAAATGAAVSTILLAGLDLEAVPLFIVFAATLFVYSLNRITDLEEDERNVPGRAAFTRRYGRVWFAIGVTLYLAAIGAAFALSLPGAAFLVLPLVVTTLYSLFRVKRVFLVKNLIVGLSWGIIPLGVGVYYDVLWTVEILYCFGFFAVMLTVAAAIFDIKDIEGDLERGIRTVPNVFGPRLTRIAAGVVTVLVAATVLVFVAVGVLPREFLLLLAFDAYVLAYIPFANQARGPLFYGFVVDGEHVFLAILALAIL